MLVLGWAMIFPYLGRLGRQAHLPRRVLIQVFKEHVLEPTLVHSLSCLLVHFPSFGQPIPQLLASQIWLEGLPLQLQNSENGKWQVNVWQPSICPVKLAWVLFLES